MHKLGEIDLAKKLPDSLGAHLCLEGILILLLSIEILLLGKNLTFLKGRISRLYNHPILIVKDVFKLGGSLVEKKTHPRGAALEEPDVADGNGKLDVSHALTADGSERYLNSAAVADHTFVLDALILSASALPVLGRSENLLAE